jgi:hypothetical protein
MGWRCSVRGVRTLLLILAAEAVLAARAAAQG